MRYKRGSPFVCEMSWRKWTDFTKKQKEGVVEDKANNKTTKSNHYDRPKRIHRTSL